MKVSETILNTFRLLSALSVIVFVAAYSHGSMDIAAVAFIAIVINIAMSVLMYLYVAFDGFDDVHFPWWMGGL